MIGNHEEEDKININGIEIDSSKNGKFLGVLIDKNLSFDVHVLSRYEKAGQKLPE